MVSDKASPALPPTTSKGLRIMGKTPRFQRFLIVTAAALPAACAMPPPPNPFLGAWATSEHNSITFRDSTLVVSPNGATQTIEMNPQECAGRFRFDYGRKSRDALTALVPRQPELRAKLDTLLRQPDYPVAELGCDKGDNTYVLLDDRDLLAIYRDGDVAAVEQLSRL
jgi:hypothetical protein